MSNAAKNPARRDAKGEFRFISICISKLYNNPLGFYSLIVSCSNSYSNILVSGVKYIRQMFWRLQPCFLLGTCRSEQNSDVLSKILKRVFTQIDFIVGMLSLRIYVAKNAVRRQIVSSLLRQRIEIRVFFKRIKIAAGSRLVRQFDYICNSYSVINFFYGTDMQTRPTNWVADCQKHQYVSQSLHILRYAASRWFPVPRIIAPLYKFAI